MTDDESPRLRPPPFPTDRETLETECTVEFLKGSGPGGQHRNKRETGVRLVHPPSGITILSTERRSQAQNLDAAYERLIRALTRRNQIPRPRRTTRPTPASIRKRLEVKRRRSTRKSSRRSPAAEE